MSGPEGLRRAFDAERKRAVEHRRCHVENYNGNPRQCFLALEHVRLAGELISLEREMLELNEGRAQCAVCGEYRGNHSVTTSGVVCEVCRDHFKLEVIA